MSLACEIFIQIAAVTRTIFCSISVYVKDQVSTDGGTESREREKYPLRFAIINLVSLAQSREKVVEPRHVGFSREHLSVRIDRSGLIYRILHVPSDKALYVAGVKGGGGGKRGSAL